MGNHRTHTQPLQRWPNTRMDFAHSESVRRRRWQDACVGPRCTHTQPLHTRWQRWRWRQDARLGLIVTDTKPVRQRRRGRVHMGWRDAGTAIECGYVVWLGYVFCPDTIRRCIHPWSTYACTIQLYANASRIRVPDTCANGWVPPDAWYVDGIWLWRWGVVVR